MTFNDSFSIAAFIVCVVLFLVGKWYGHTTMRQKASDISDEYLYAIEKGFSDPEFAKLQQLVRSVRIKLRDRIEGM